MRVYLRTDLAKAKKDNKQSSQSNEQGEQRGGNYVARMQIGYEKDGSPKYKYFDSLEARDKYLQNRGKTGEDQPKRLKQKLAEEQAQSKNKQKASHGKVESGGLFVKEKKKKDTDKEDTKKKVKKSISGGTPMFIWSFEE